MSRKIESSNDFENHFWWNKGLFLCVLLLTVILKHPVLVFDGFPNLQHYHRLPRTYQCRTLRRCQRCGCSSRRRKSQPGGRGERELNISPSPNPTTDSRAVLCQSDCSGSSSHSGCNVKLFRAVSKCILRCGQFTLLQYDTINHDEGGK